MSATGNKKRIGILGGMGPEATIFLMARIVAMTEAADDCDHVAMLVDNNTQVPSRIEAILEKTGADPAPALADMARRLVACGADGLAMPCNTAHHYADVIVNATDMPFLNMVDLVVERALAMNLENRRIGVLASPAVRTTAIYDRAFSKRDLQTLYPQDQDRMLDAIRRIKANGKDPRARQTLQDAAHELMDGGADVVLVACSEFSIIADELAKTFPCLDAIDVLAGEIIEFTGAKRRPVEGGASA